MRKFCLERHRNRRGAALLEYGILAGLISVVALTSVQALGTKVRDVFLTTAEVLSSDVPAVPVSPDASGGTGGGSDPATGSTTDPVVDPPVISGPHITWKMTTAVNKSWIGTRSTYYDFNYGEMISFEGDAEPVMLVGSSTQTLLALHALMGNDFDSAILTCDNGAGSQITRNGADATRYYASGEDAYYFQWSGSTFIAGDTYDCVFKP